jgi:tetratricopeptide (TPR) repeat protein
MLMQRKLLTLLFISLLVLGLGVWVWQISCDTRPAATTNKPQIPIYTAKGVSIALVPQKGTEAIDRELRSLQNEARSKSLPPEIMTRLGWAFVRKARLSYDPGYYKLAEQCTLSVQTRHPGNPDALLLQGHILQSLHEFKEAEPIARELIKVRNDASDHGLLGDVLMEQGKLSAAIDAYQEMMDLRPDPEAYTRVAHMRWLKGDLGGAIEMMEMAAAAASPREPEPGAWAYTRLGIYSLQAGQLQIAERSASFALQYINEYPPALLLREEVEQKLISSGPANDPRTFALFLATRQQQLAQCLQLALDELKTRQDILTMDALAWALRANGRAAEALSYSQKSVAEGTQDGRLFYHAGCVAMENARYAEASDLFARADQIKQTLFPSEQTDLNKQCAVLKEIEAKDSTAQHATAQTAN